MKIVIIYYLCLFCSVRAHHAAIAQEMMYFEKEENEVRHTYHVGSFRGYSAKLNDKYVACTLLIIICFYLLLRTHGF